MLWAQPLYLPVKWQWSRTFLYFSASFFSFYKCSEIPHHVKKIMGSIIESFFIFIRHSNFFIILHSFFYVISYFIKVIAKHINGILSSTQKFLISILNSIHQVQHKSARFMLLIIVGFNFTTFRLLSSSVKHSKSACTTKGHLNFSIGCLNCSFSSVVGISICCPSTSVHPLS